MRRSFAGLLLVCLLAGGFGGTASAGEASYWFAHTARVPYSIGPSGPVTFRCVTDADVLFETEEGFRTNFCYYCPWLEDRGYHDEYWEGELTDEVALDSFSPDFRELTLSFLKPGKHKVLGGAAVFYVIDPDDETKVALIREMEAQVEKSRGKTEKDTARKLHDWLCKRVKYLHDRDGEDWEENGLRGDDPFGVLLGGRAKCGGYSNVYCMLLRMAGIECLCVSGTAGNDGHTWNLCRLDGVWCFVDVTWDDPDSGMRSKYFALDLQKMSKDHTLRPDWQTFWDTMIDTTPYDRLIAGE